MEKYRFKLYAIFPIRWNIFYATEEPNIKSESNIRSYALCNWPKKTPRSRPLLQEVPAKLQLSPDLALAQSHSLTTDRVNTSVTSFLLNEFLFCRNLVPRTPYHDVNPGDDHSPVPPLQFCQRMLHISIEYEKIFSTPLKFAKKARGAGALFRREASLVRNFLEN